MRAAKVQVSLCIRAVSPEPPLLAHTSDLIKSDQKYIGKNFIAQRRVTPKSMVRSGQNSNSSEILSCPDLCKSHQDLIKTKQAMLRTSEARDLAGIRICLRVYGCPGYLEV